MISIIDGRVFVEGKETVDPTLIGYALLDAAEDENFVICTWSRIEKLIIKAHTKSFKAGQKRLQEMFFVKEINPKP